MLVVAKNGLSTFPFRICLKDSAKAGGDKNYTLGGHSLSMENWSEVFEFTDSRNALAAWSPAEEQSWRIGDKDILSRDTVRLWFMIRIYFFLSKNPWDFLSDERHKGVFGYVHVVTFGRHPRIGLVSRGTNHVIGGWNFQSQHSPYLWGGERSWRLNWWQMTRIWSIMPM